MKYLATASAFIFALCASSVVANAANFTLSSTSIPATGLLPMKYGFDQSNCGGANVSPALAWSDAPAATKSFAITMHDVDGQGGLGYTHWVAYGIAPGISSFAEGAVSAATPLVVGGRGTAGATTYRGPCPGPGTNPHHYLFNIFALDLEPTALAPGLTRDELYAAMKGHVLAGSSLIAPYAR